MQGGWALNPPSWLLQPLAACEEVDYDIGCRERL